MTLDQATLDLIELARQAQPTAALARRLIAMIDLTSLDDDDTPEKISRLCQDALTPAGPVAAVCIFPGFIRQAKSVLAGTGVRVATVIDFPSGVGDPEDILRETDEVLREGADEIDLVFPYRRFLADIPPPASKNIRAAREAGGYDFRLKVILEAGAYPNEYLLAQAASIAIDGGADFLKTSTGRHAVGPSLESAAVVLSTIKACGLPIGFKLSGGVRDIAQASAYLALAESIMGAGWATPDSFRIGASALLPKLIEAL